jgi:tRNA G18 (ribose-2'-O)-methylase SpoU
MRKLHHDEIARKRLRPDEITDDLRIPVTALVDNVRSLYNVGSIFRTSDGAVIQKLILTGFTPHPPRKEIDKTALGSTKTVPWEYCKNPLDAVQQLKDRGTKVYCLELTDNARPYYDIRPADYPLCVVIGNEIVGVSHDIIKHCDAAIEIPMYGMKQSLNVAVAYGITIFELARIWRASAGNGPHQNFHISKANV